MTESSSEMRASSPAVPVALFLSAVLVFAVALFLVPVALGTSGLAFQVGMVVVPLAVLGAGLYLVITGLR